MHRAVREGDTVRSFDFSDSQNSYIEGRVLSVGGEENNFGFFDCPRYKIVVQRRVWEGADFTNESPAIGQHVYPPVNGTPTGMGRVTNLVKVIE